MSDNTKLTALFLFAFTLLVYGLSYNGEGRFFNYFIFLAEAFLHGQLNVLTHPAWLNELVSWNNHYYVVYPPMPAILLVPFVALFGIDFPQPLLSILIGAVNVSLAYLVLVGLFQNKRVAFWISILYAFGSMYWYHAEVGSAWYIAHIIANLFLWLMLLEVTGKKRLFLTGLFIGFAYLSRLPAILASVFVFFYLMDKFINFKRASFTIYVKNIILFILGLLPALLTNAFYNYFRFGVFNDQAYNFLPLLKEPWYNHGFLSIWYLPLRLKEVFFAMPTFISHFPYIIPNLYAMALWVVTPAFLLIPFAPFKNRLVYSSLLATIAIAIPSLTKGGNGFTQFGFRYFLDLMPFLLIITAAALKGKVSLTAKFLILLSTVINTWGVIFISHLGLWSL